MTETAGEVHVESNAEPVLVLVYAVKTAGETIELPRTPKVDALLESWLKANGATPTEDGAWLVGARGETLDFAHAVGYVATLPA